MRSHCPCGAPVDRPGACATCDYVAAPIPPPALEVGLGWRLVVLVLAATLGVVNAVFAVLLASEARRREERETCG
jgi:hypothetical protein